MRSRLLECRVFHDRFVPHRHKFSYRVFMLALDLDELDAVSKQTRILQVNRSGIFSFRESDFLQMDQPVHNPTTGIRTKRKALPGADSSASLKTRVGKLLRQHGVTDSASRVELITMPRVVGYLFNPVSFYFCYDADDQPIAVIAEVSNTFGEMKPYVLDRACWKDGAFHLRVPKHFYVSPFSDVDVAFDFKLRPVSEKLGLEIDDYADGRRTFTSKLTGSARPLRDVTLLCFVVKYPLLTLKVITAIHWQALLLKLKKIPWYAKAARASDQRDLFRPHRSLNAQTHSKR